MAHDVEFEVRLRANGAGIFSPSLQKRPVRRDFGRSFAHLRKKTVRDARNRNSSPEPNQ